MSPTRFRHPRPALLAILFICGCAVETRDGSELPAAKPAPATAAMKVGTVCQPAAACPPAVSATMPSPATYYSVAPAPPAPPGSFAPAIYAVPPAPVAPAVATYERNQRRPVGTWEREVGTRRITLRFEEDRLFGVGILRDGKDTGTVSVEADYSVTKDNVVYGVVTSIELTGRDDPQAPTVCFDMPFSVRIRQDGDTLTVKGLKVLQYGYESRDADFRDLVVLEGRYKKKLDGKTAH